MTCKECKHNISGKCSRYPKWIDIKSPDTHFCGDYERPIAVMIPPTAEEIKLRKQAERGQMDDDERRKRAMKDYEPPARTKG